MTKARNLADNALTTVSPTELGYVDGVTSSIQTQLDGKLANALVDAKGDILTATADNTPARLAVGTNGQVLTAASGQATGLQWATPAAGSLTLLETATPSGVSTYTFSSISGSYKRLYLQFQALAFTTATLAVRVNGITATNCYVGTFSRSSTTANVIAGGTYTSLHVGATGPYQIDGGMNFYNYASTALSGKTYEWNICYLRLGSIGEVYKGTGAIVGSTANGAEGCAAVTSITIFTVAGQNFDSGSMSLYGEN